MKKIFLFLTLALFGYLSNAQEMISGYRIDTLTNTDTVYFYVGGTNTANGASIINEYGSLALTIVTDSLSGSTAGTAIVQYCDDNTNTNWYTFATLSALNGAASQVQIATEDAVFLARKARVRLTGSGTASTKCRLYYCFKGAN